MTLITLSASYGAGGSQVGPLLAQRLGIEFIDRAIPAAVAERLEVPVADAISHEQPAAGRFERMLARFAPVGSTYGAPLALGEPLGERAYADATDAVVRERAARGDAVILGRAAAIVLADERNALHVRLDGPKERRIERVMRHEGVTRELARQRLERNDRAREAYVRQFYGTDPRDPAHYHLVIDTTRIGLEPCVELILLAARAEAGAETHATT